jgi:serine/threonine protein kinase
LPTDGRLRFLDDNINGDQTLRREVEKLLASDEHAETLFDGKSLIAPKDFAAKDVIGNYEIIKKIGEGGMGAVFLAERADIQQRVALKIIRHGANSDVILKRFRREQEILAALEHPNIARLIDVGVSETGVPFLAMEYVEGVDLIAYTDQKNLSVGEK